MEFAHVSGLAGEVVVTSRVLFAANRGFALLGSRRALMERLMSQGHAVAIATANDEHAHKLESLGIQRFAVDFRRGGVAPIADLCVLKQLLQIYRSWRPQLVHHFHAKPMFYGALAARAAGVPSVVNTVTGLGESMPERGLRSRLSRQMYAHACNMARFTVFQNSDDMALFQRGGLVPQDGARLITSSGVDVRRFLPGEGVDAPARVVCMARLLKKKGIHEFIQAARLVRARLDLPVVFELAGEWDIDHPDAISEAELSSWNFDEAVRFIGYCQKPETWLAGASAFVCPSVYREGVPRVILEAAACGVPVIGTDAPGIRDVLKEGQTGYLVAPFDVAAIAERLVTVLSDSGRVAEMSASARRLMESQFDIEHITDQYLDLYREAGLS